MVSIGIMNTQINLRLSEKMLSLAKEYSRKNGFGSIQEFIKETLREKLFEPTITKQELETVKKLAMICEKQELYGTEDELFKKLRRK